MSPALNHSGRWCRAPCTQWALLSCRCVMQPPVPSADPLSYSVSSTPLEKWPSAWTLTVDLGLSCGASAGEFPFNIFKIINKSYTFSCKWCLFCPCSARLSGWSGFHILSCLKKLISMKFSETHRDSGLWGHSESCQGPTFSQAEHSQASGLVILLLNLSGYPWPGIWIKSAGVAVELLLQASA